MMDKVVKNLYKIVGARIALKRKVLHFSQEQLAEYAGVHRTYVGFVERAERGITLLTLYKITKALDIKLEELFKGF